jgi:hypothetical protein
MIKQLFFFLLIFSSCSNITLLTLYDIEVEAAEGIDGFTSTEIFSKGGSDEVWGMDDENCNPFSFSAYDASFDYSKINTDDEKTQEKEDLEEVKGKYNLPAVKVKDRKYVVKNSIHLKTSKKPSCEWIGMGIGWDGWQGKDLSSVMESAAIEMLIRVEKGAISNLPVVFILEDYSENQCYATASYLGIDGGKITSKWTRVVVPLQTFSYRTNKINLTNIKQLMLQCYDATDVFIDNIKIIKHDHQYERLEDNLTVYDSLSPITIFKDSLFASWGVGIKGCKNFTIAQNSKKTSSFIAVDLSSNSCNWNSFGISWNKWKYTDISHDIKNFKLNLDIKRTLCKSFTITFEDYKGKKLSYTVEKELLVFDKKNSSEWGKVSVPLNLFPIRKSKIDLSKIKQLIFKFDKDTRLELDNITLTKN